MKPLKWMSAIGLALVVAVGCEQSNTTKGPASATSPSSSAKKLTVTAATQQTIKRGDTDDFVVKINRDNFNDPVTIRLNDLPKGVECTETEAVIPSGSTSFTFKLKADETAEIGEHQVKVDAQAPGLAENVQTVKLTIKDKS